MKEFTLQEKIGQLVAVGFHGTLPSDPQVEKLREQIKAGQVSGVLFYRYNIETPQQIQNLIGELNNAESKAPLFIMLDQEGGKVQRLVNSKGFKETRSAHDVATNMNEAEALEHYQELGKTLHETGFNFDFAPCVDLDGDPQCPAIGKLERSYSSDPAKVVAYAETMVAGLGQSQVVSCIKHFPGHGRAGADSHVGMVDITDTWSETELEPYRQMIKDQAVDSVMTAHLAHREVDNGRPITFSKVWIDKLRNEMSFDGVVVTDDLHMGAIIRNYNLKDVAINALKAGTDLLIFSNNPLASKAQGIRYDEKTGVVTTEDGNWTVPDPDLALKVCQVIETAVRDGEIPEDLIENAFRRVSKLKSSL